MIRALQEFVDTSLEEVLVGVEDEAAARARVLELFHSVARDVPAYAAFLAEREIDPDSVRTFADFQRLPLIDKHNYHQRYPLRDLCRHGRLEANDFVAVSSGSTGQPTFWPRYLTDELAVARRFEQVFHDSFRADKRSTLAVVCFALGTWVGGMFTASCCRHLAARGYPLTAVTPGNNSAEILRVVELGPGVAPSDDKADAIAESILRHLLRLNSEFANYVPLERQRPRVELAARGDPAWFPVGVKHRYTRR